VKSHKIAKEKKIRLPKTFTANNFRGRHKADVDTVLIQV